MGVFVDFGESPEKGPSVEIVRTFLGGFESDLVGGVLHGYFRA